ncbi:3-deoxy-D-manno-octulosonic acid transferase [Pinisolibacter sp.]|uniref:3-deoxy-D-manno-octulosonic acid transferase n=1 Tax=Pinisolibacter sp. TaxID=2172024 RepID=UPI002FDD67C9
MSEILADLALRSYRAAGRLAAPLVALALRRRERAGKEDAARRGERRGRASLPRPAGRLVWLHAASVGETMAALGLVERLAATGASVLVTTGTVTSAEVAAARLPAGAFHQYVPADVAAWVDRFLDHWRPDLAVFVESEIWPATILALAMRGTPQVLVNARISERSARRWGSLDGLPRALFGRLALVLAQSEDDAVRLRRLGAPQVTVSGNLKFDGSPLAVDEAELFRLTAAFDGRPTWVAASTHAGEEAVVAAAHPKARDAVPRLLCVLAPRHPRRGDEVRAVLAAAGLSVASRSLGETPGPETDVYLADTIGEMGLVYRLAPVAFVGGSLVPRGGQNPIEPARLGVAVLHGPQVRNFADIYRVLDATCGARAVADADALATAIVDAHADPATLAGCIDRARVVIDASTGAVERTFAALAPWIPPVAEGS